MRKERRAPPASPCHSADRNHGRSGAVGPLTVQCIGESLEVHGWPRALQLRPMADLFTYGRAVCSEAERLMAWGFEGWGTRRSVRAGFWLVQFAGSLGKTVDVAQTLRFLGKSLFSGSFSSRPTLTHLHLASVSRPQTCVEKRTKYS